MATFLIPDEMITEEMLRNREEYNKRRHLLTKYTLEELENWLKVDLYEALDLEYFRDKEIPEDVLSYTVKKKSTLYHPTKNRGVNHAFLIIKRAEQVFSTPKYRKVYDSAFLDETIPEDRPYEKEEFFEVFSDVFRRNGLFSAERPVPSLEQSDVESFYKFWFNFKTDRVYDDPADVFDQRGSSRRYLADKNKEILQKKKAADVLRIHELVKIAYKRDHRIKRADESKSAPWSDAEVKMLEKLNVIMGKSKDKLGDICKKLNDLYLNKRTPSDIKTKLESIKKK